MTCQDIEALERELLEENEKLQKSESACQLSKEKRFFQYNNIIFHHHKINVGSLFQLFKLVHKKLN